MRILSIDIETYSDVDLSKSGVYPYAESDNFEILFFGYSVDGHPPQVIDLANGEQLPDDIIAALTDPNVIKTAYNAMFERICISKHLGLPKGTYLDPTQWHCTMVWAATLGLPMSLAGVGAVLGFVPQMLVLFILLAILEACGYMARIAFVMDRIFRKFGLSGKSFIPILVGTGCGIPGIMASRTIENERDRRMTVMTTTFIPCGAKQPFIAMIAGAIFGGSAWIATGAYFLGMAAIVVSGIILKKTKMFAGDPAPFVMELPAYHMPTVGNVLRSMWERGWSFIKKAGTIITLSTIFVWFTSYFGWVDGAFQMLSEDQMSHSILAYIGKGICWIFAPLGWGNWQATVAAVTGLVAKENIVATMGILYGGGDGTYANLAAAFTGVAGMSFLIFNLLCAPCFAAMGAIKREMNNTKWFWFAIGYECGFAYVISLIVNQLGNLFTGQLMTAGNAVVNIVSLIVSFALIIVMIYLLVRPYKESNKLGVKVKA